MVKNSLMAHNIHPEDQEKGVLGLGHDSYGCCTVAITEVVVCSFLVWVGCFVLVLVCLFVFHHRLR